MVDVWRAPRRPSRIRDHGRRGILAFPREISGDLFDIAQEHSDFDAFRKEVERFFYEPDANGEDERLWENALMAIRCGGVAPPDEFSELPRESPESNPSQITVELLNDVGKRFMPSDNVRDTYSIPCSLAA